MVSVHLGLILTLMWKLFADDTSFFSVVYDIDTSANDFNHDLEKISDQGQSLLQLLSSTFIASSTTFLYTFQYFYY